MIERNAITYAMTALLALLVTGCVVMPDVPHSVLANSRSGTVDADLLSVHTNAAGITTSMSRTIPPAGQPVRDATDQLVISIQRGMVDWQIHAVSPDYLTADARDAHAEDVQRLASMIAEELPQILGWLENRQETLLPYKLRLDLYPFNARTTLRHTAQTRDAVDLRFALRAPSRQAEHRIDDRTWMVETIASLFHEYYHVLVSHTESLHFPNAVSEETAAHLFDACVRVPFLPAGQAMNIGIPPEIGGLSEDMSTFDYGLLRRNLGRVDSMVARWIAYTTVAFNVGTASIAADSADFERLERVCATAEVSGRDFTAGRIIPLMD